MFTNFLHITIGQYIANWIGVSKATNMMEKIYDLALVSSIVLVVLVFLGVLQIIRVLRIVKGNAKQLQEIKDYLEQNKIEKEDE